jgi:hypothetical protein
VWYTKLFNNKKNSLQKKKEEEEEKQLSKYFAHTQVKYLETTL